MLIHKRPQPVVDIWQKICPGEAERDAELRHAAVSNPAPTVVRRAAFCKTIIGGYPGPGETRYFLD
jgi:hypothetical protein